MNKVWLEREKEKHSRHVYFSFCKLTTQDSMYAVAKLYKAGGGTWVFFEWVCAARDSKLAPRSKKKYSPKIDTPI